MARYYDEENERWVSNDDQEAEQMTGNINDLRSLGYMPELGLYSGFDRMSGAGGNSFANDMDYYTWLYGPGVTKEDINGEIFYKTPNGADAYLPGRSPGTVRSPDQNFTTVPALALASIIGAGAMGGAFGGAGAAGDAAWGVNAAADGGALLGGDLASQLGTSALGLGDAATFGASGLGSEFGTAALGLGGAGSSALTGAGGGILESILSGAQKYIGSDGFYGDLLKGGLNLFSGASGANAAEDAANAQLAGTDRAISEQRRQYDLSRADNAPFMQTGIQANRRLAALLGIDPAQAGASGYGDLTRKFTMADRDADPVYQSGLQFGLDEGTKGINARATAMGNYDSGATLKALTRFGNDYGSTKAEGAYNRFNTDNTNIYNRLAGVSGAGQTATNTVTSAGANTANNVSNLETGAGNSRAAGIVGGQNAWGSALSGISQGIDNSSNRALLERILGGRGY